MRTKVLAVAACCAVVLLASVAPAGATDPTTAPTDFTGDGISDLAVVRSQDSTWTWFIRDTSTGIVDSNQFGDASGYSNYYSRDIPLEGDFDGDGRADQAVWRRDPTYWFITSYSSGGYGFLNFGEGNDFPVVADFDGDGRTDVAVVRRGSDDILTWYFAFSDGNYGSAQFGQAYDYVSAGDFDGDRRADLVVRRIDSDNNYHWYFAFANGAYSDTLFGQSTDYMVQGDFTGEGVADIAVARTIWSESVLRWYVTNTSTGEVTTFDWGDSNLGDFPLSGDYNGDGRADAFVWRYGSPDYWYARDSETGYLIDLPPFGTNAYSDQPVGWYQYMSTINPVV